MYTRECTPQRVVLSKLFVEYILVFDIGLNLLFEVVNLIGNLHFQVFIVVERFLFLGDCLFKLIQNGVSYHLSLLELELLRFSYILGQISLNPVNRTGLRLILLLF